MKLRIETMDWVIWLLIIVPVIALMAYGLSLEAVFFLFLGIPVMIALKNEYLLKQYGWKAEYGVGIASLDEDHQKLVKMITTLFKSMQRSNNKDEAKEILDELSKYIVDHFDREESLMKKHQYPELERHCKEHEDMKAKVMELKEKFIVDSMEVSQEILRYLQEWLINHITKTDKAYSIFLLERGEK
ncbi:MAG: hemerythrin family protein [Magnetococcales bacterium]|nr:hemerythrin family protein [Magnetococcales bacterium]NGZ27745.1 hemerythrin family protein [Magnetococcales bacterium]